MKEKIIEQRPRWLKVGYVLQILLPACFLLLTWDYYFSSFDIIPVLTLDNLAYIEKIYVSYFFFNWFYFVLVYYVTHQHQTYAKSLGVVATLLVGVCVYYYLFSPSFIEGTFILEIFMWLWIFFLMQIGFGIGWLSGDFWAKRINWFKFALVLLIGLYVIFWIVLNLNKDALEAAGPEPIIKMYCYANIVGLYCFTILTIRLFQKKGSASIVLQGIAVGGVLYALFSYEVFNGIAFNIDSNELNIFFLFSVASVILCLVLFWQNRKNNAPQSSDANLLDDFEEVQ